MRNALLFLMNLLQGEVALTLKLVIPKGTQITNTVLSVADTFFGHAAVQAALPSAHRTIWWHVQCRNVEWTFL